MSEELQATAARCGIDLTAAQALALQAYADRLWDWNTRLNLTRHTDLERFVQRDLLDTVRLAECLGDGEKVLDVGSGGGVPGIPLAILRPDLTVELSESVGKKARVLEDLVQGLQLQVPVRAGRAEACLETTSYDTLVLRGVGSLARVLTWFAPSWGRFGRLLLIKGPNWVQERAEARHRGLLRSLELRRAASYRVPATGAESVILSIRPSGERSLSS